MSGKNSRKVRMGSSRQPRQNQDEHETNKDDDGSQMLSKERKVVEVGADSVSVMLQTDLVSSDNLSTITQQHTERNNPPLNYVTESHLSQPVNPYLLKSLDTAGKRRKMGSTRQNKRKPEETDFGVIQDTKTGDTEQSLELQASIAVVESESHRKGEECLGPKESEMNTQSRSQSEFLLFASNTLNQPDDRCKEEVGEDTEPRTKTVISYGTELLQDTLGTESLLHLPLDLAVEVVHGLAAEPITEELKKEEERRQESEHTEVESPTFLSSRQSLDQSLESDTLTNTEEFESFNNTIILQSGEGEEKLEPVVNESELQDDINSTGPGNQETLHQRDEDENFVDLIVEENIVMANITPFRQPDHVESIEPKQSEDMTCFLQSTPSDSSLGHDKSAQSESRRRKMGSTRRNPRGRHEEEEHGESKMHGYRYLYDEGEEVILGKEEMFGIEETEFEISMEPKDSANVDKKEGEPMEKEKFQTEEDTENIGETGRGLERDMGTVEGSGVEISEESLMLLEPEHGADEEKKGMEEERLIEPTPFDQYIDSFGIADQLYNQEKGNRFTVDSVNTETESNNEASMAHKVDPIEPFSVGLDQSGVTLLREEEVSDYTLLVNNSEVIKCSQIAYDCALTLESDDTFSTDPKISASQLIQTPCMEITNPFLKPLFSQSIQGNEGGANTDPNTTGGLDTSEVMLLSEEEMSDHVPLVNEVSVSSQMTYDDRTLTTEPCQTDEALSTDPNISASQLNQTPYSDESHNSFPNSLLLQSVQDQGDNAANINSNQSPSPSRRRKMGSTRRPPRVVQREEEDTEEKQEVEIESTEIEDKRENTDAVEGSCMEFEMLMESKDGAGIEKNEGEERNEETLLTDLSCSFSTSYQEGRNIEADNIESESQSIIKESMATKLLLLREVELTQISQTLHNSYPDVPTIESYDSYLTDDTLNSNPAITGLQHKGTSLEETLDESRGNTDSPPDPPSLQSSLGSEETAEVESYTPGRKRKIGSTRSKSHPGRKGEERREEGQEEEKGEDTDVIGEVGDVITTAEMDSSIEKTELVELEELLEKVTEEQAMGDPAIIVVEGEVNIVVEGESGIERSEFVEHTEKVRVAEEIEVEVKIVAESESNQTPSDTAALTVEAQESCDMVCIEPYITSQYLEDNNPSLNDLTEINLSQTENPYLLESPDTAKKRRKRGSTRRNKGKQAETDFGEKQDAKTGDTETSLQLQASIAVVESWSYSNTEELLGKKESEMDTECLLFASNTLDKPDDRWKEEVGEDIEPSSEAVVSYSSELLQDTLGTESLLHLPLDLALQVVHGLAAEPITEESKKEEERRQESEHTEVESPTFLSSRQSLDQSLESDTLTNTEEFESFNNTIILQSGEGEEKLEPVVNESELQDDINSTGPGNQETLHQRDEDENFVDLIVEENIVMANITPFRQPDHVESIEPEQSEDMTCFLQSTPSDSSLGHDKSAQSESRRRKMGSTRRNPRGRHEEEEHGESKMHGYRYLYDEGEEVILGKEEMFGIEETEFEISMEPKDSANVDEKEGEQMEKENFQTEEDTENIGETGRGLERDMGTVEGSGVETSEESLMLLEPEHGADEEKKGMEEERLIEPTPFDQYIDSFGIADQLYNQEKGNRFTVDSVNTETESNNEASMAHNVDSIEPFSVGLDQSGVTLLREEEVSDYTLLVNNSEVIKCSQIAYDCGLTLESDDTFSTDPNISASQLNQTPYSDESHNSFPNSLLLQSVQDQGDNAANINSNQSPSPSRRRKMGSTRRHPRVVQREDEDTEEKQEVEIESTEIEDKRENTDAVEGSCMEFEMLMESKDGAGIEKNEGEERNEETLLTDLSCSFSTSNQEGRNIEADNIESESQSIIKESMATKLLLLREVELTQISQTRHNTYPDVPTIESYDSYLTDDTLNSNPAITGLQHKGTSLEETLDESRGNTDSPPDPPSLQSYLGSEETAEVESYTPGRKRKIGSTRSKSHPGRKGEERREEGQEEEKSEDTDVIGEVGDVITTAEMDSSIEKTELVELEELLEKVTEEQAMGDPAIIVVEGEVNIVVEGESGIERSEFVEHTEKVRVAEEIEVEVKIVAESESNQTPSDTAALTVEAQESCDMVCIEPYITSQYLEDNNPSLNDLTEINLSQTENPYLLESPDTAKKRRKRGSTRRNKGKQAETDFGEKQDAKTGDTETSLQLQASIAVVESWSYSNTEELLGKKEREMDTECLLFASNTLDKPDDRWKEEVGEDIEPSSEAVVSYSSELLQDTLGTESLLHLPLDLALQVVHGLAAEPITEESKKEEERRQESEHTEVESPTFLSSRQSLDQSLESDTLTNTEEFESFNNTIILQSGEGEEKLEPVVNESELQDDINSTGPGNQETLHQRDEDENFVDLIVEENIVMANITPFRQPDHVESIEPEQSEDMTCFLQSTPSDSSLGHDKSAQSESRRRKMGSTRRNPRGRHEEEEHGESKMHGYRYLYDEGEEVILGKEEMFGIEETEFEISMEPKDSANVDEKEGEQMEKENFQTEEDTENIGETGRGLERDMGTVEGSGVETSEESLMLLEPEHGADEEKKGMEEERLIEPTPFDQYIDSFGIADQLYNQEKGNRFTADSVNTETESNNEASMAHNVDSIEPFSVGLDQSGVTLLREEEVSDYTLLVNNSEVIKCSQIAYDCGLTLESDDTFSTDPKISPSQLNQTPYSDESHNSFPNSLLLQSVQDQGDNAANINSNQSPSPSRRRKIGSTRRHPRVVQREDEDTEEKQEVEIESTEIEDKRENTDAVEGSCMEFEMLMESKDGAGIEKNEGEERNEETVLTDLSCSFSTSNQEGRNIEADNIESESQSIIKESMATKLLLLREVELTQISQTRHNTYPDVPTIESYDSYLTDDTLNSNPAITGLQHKGTSLEETLDESRGNTDSPPDPPSLQSSLGSEETAEVESYTPGRKRKIGSTRSKSHPGRKGEERREEGQEEEKGEDTDVIGEVGDVITTAEMDSSIEKTELVELEELLEKVTEEQAMGDPAIIVVEGEVNIVVEGESGIERSEFVEHTEKVRVAEEIEVEVKIVAESESNQTPSDTAALTVEAQESCDMVCIEPYITSQYLEDNNPSLNDLTEINLSQTENPYLLESPDTAKKRRKRGSTRRNKGKQAETDFGEKQDAKTGDTEKSLQLQASIAVVESWSYSNTEELLGKKESETDTECLLFASNTLDKRDDRWKEEVGEDIEPSSEAVVSYSSELLQDTLGTESLLHLPLDLALQVVHGLAAEPITEELKKEEERRQESEHTEVESPTFLSSRQSLDQSLESDTLTNTEEFESFNNTIILQSGEGEEKLEPVVNESELQDDINSTGPGNQETLHQRDEDENFVDLIVEENIVMANITPFRQPDHVESIEPEQSEDMTCFLQSTPSDSSLGHDKSAQSESRRRKMGSTRRNPRGRHEEEEHGESKMHGYRYLYDEGEEVILGKEEMFGIEETEFEISMEPKDSASVDEKEGEQMEKENFQTEEDTENIGETGRGLERDMGTVEGSGVETSEESLMLLEPEHGADEEKKGMEEERLIEPTPFDQYIDSFGIADQLYNQEKGNRFTVDSVNTETESNIEASMAHNVDPIEPFSVGLDQSGVTLLREEKSIQGNEGGANTDPNTTGGLDTSEVMLLSEEEMSDHVPLVNESVQDQGDNAANINSNQSPSPSRRRKMGSTRRPPRVVQREEEDTEEKQEVEIESTEIEDKRENMDAVQGSCMEFEMLMESKDGAGNEKNEGEERNEETVLTDLSCSFSTSNQEGRNIEADNIESESQSIINHSMTAKLMLLHQSDFSEIWETLHNPDVPNLESHLTDDTLISTEKVREVEIEVEVNTVMESESSQTDTAALTVEAQESGDMVCIDPHISAIQHTQTADMEQCLLTQSNSPSLPSKSSLSLSSQSHEDVGESKATGKRRKMGFTHQTQGGLHAEDEKQETGENITEAEVRAETIGNPEVNDVLERFQEERRAEAVSLEDQQEIQSTEKETILIEVVASSTVLSGKGSEPVAPAPQPGPGNKRGQEKAERVEKPPGTFGSSGSSSNPYNVVMVGNSSVGKTSFMRRFQSGEFCRHHDATIGIDTCIQSVTVDGSPVTLQLWDTAGQERFHSITRQVFHKAQGLMLMYDITSSQSFCDICYWVNCIQEGAPDDVIVILLGNKTDCAELDREVQTHEGENLAKGYDMLFMECSAATGDNVTLSMETLARMLKQLGEQTRQEEGSLVLQKEPPMKKSGCC
uniref:Uncharacterized protein n=1 Tax=Oncorhynchus mykiss TaxID=8022 RepID=A0A8K9V3I3_ONCMY